MIRLQIYIFSFLMLLILLIQLISKGEGFLPLRLLKAMIISTMVATSLEAISWVCDGQLGPTSRAVALLANGLLLALNAVPLIAWTLYLDLRVHRDAQRIKRKALPLIGLFTIHALLALSGPLNGLYFYIDSGNFYHRGVLAPTVSLIFIALLLYDALLLLRNWGKLEQREGIALLVSVLLPLVGFYLQAKYYGLGLVWGCVSLSILIVYTATQNQVIATDYLTGLHNRQHLDQYLETVIKHPQQRQQLAGIMLDIDDFKQINDTYGHSAGDQAIRATARALRRYFRGAFVARYAGDEFVVLLESGSAAQLADLVAGFHSLLEREHASTPELYKLRVSAGAASYAAAGEQTADQFLTKLDRLMYAEKQAKAARASLVDLP